MISLDKGDNDQHHCCKQLKKEGNIRKIINILSLLNRKDERNEGDRSDKNSEKNNILK